MKKVFCFVVIMFSMIFFAGVSSAGGGGNSATAKTAIKTNYDKLYVVDLPNDISAPAAVLENIQEYSWYCDSNQTIEVKERDIQYYVVVNVPELSKWNIGSLNLSGKINGSQRIGIENLNGFVYSDPGKKEVYISFASRYCSQQYTQEYDSDADTWKCTTLPVFDCYDIDYILSDSVILSVTPYILVK